jgi:hypothetical protein
LENPRVEPSQEAPKRIVDFETAGFRPYPVRREGYLEGVEAELEAHLAVDSEGAARAGSP